MLASVCRSVLHELLGGGMRAKNIDFREVRNSGCQLCPNREVRKKYLEHGICKSLKSALDGLPLRCVGKWGQEKVFYLLQYLGIFAQGMKNSWGGNLHYLEVCSGPGRLVDFNSGIEFDGSALAVLRHQGAKLLKSALFVDKNPVVVNALNSRIQQLGEFESLRALAVHGDYHSLESMKSVLSQKGSGGLTLLFLDPTDLSIPFETVKYLVANTGHVDLFINVAIGHDFRRNATHSVLKEEFTRARDKYESFLGRPHFMSSPEVLDILENNGDGCKALSKSYLDAYMEQLRTLGFCYFGVRRIEHYYHLLFATRDKKGKHFWDQCQLIEFDGQRTLF